MNVLILCTGNSCRSQMAHGYLKHLNPALNVQSAGTKPAGEVNPNAIKVMKEIGIDISHHTSDSVDLYLNTAWDFVITVCDHAKEVCPIFAGTVKEKLHIGFDDPYDATGSEEYVMSEYRRVRDEIRVAFEDFYVQKIQKIAGSNT